MNATTAHGGDLPESPSNHQGKLADFSKQSRSARVESSHVDIFIATVCTSCGEEGPVVV
jgi:hypothetical protein